MGQSGGIYGSVGYLLGQSLGHLLGRWGGIYWDSQGASMGQSEASTGPVMEHILGQSGAYTGPVRGPIATLRYHLTTTVWC